MAFTDTTSLHFHPRRWIAMAVLLIAGFMNLIDVTIVNVALPSMQRAFDATSSEIEWVVAAYILAYALFLLPSGRMGDIVGRRRMFVLGVAVFTVASALCGFATSVEMLVGSRVIQAMGAAMMTPQTLAIVPVLFPPKERGLAFSLFGLSAGLATVTGPLLGGFLIGQDIWGLGWRPIFLVNVPVGILAVLGALRFVPRIEGAAELRNDYIGILLAGATLLLVIFPLIEGRQADWPIWCFAMLVASLPMAWVFVRWQFRLAGRGQPQLLPVSLLQNRTFLMGSALLATLFSGIPGFFLVLALYLQSGYGLTPLQSGLTTLPFSVGVLCASLIAGRFGLRAQRARIVVGAGLLCLAMIGLRLAVQTTGEAIDWAIFALPLSIGGLGLGTAVSPLYQTVLGTVGGHDTGSASGAAQAFQQVGAVLGVAIMGELFFSHLGTAADQAGYANALIWALIYNTAAFLAICLVVLFVYRPPKPSEQH
ncbi:MAG: MFS transporter [Cereibacter sphaeroides]|uniref:MFS transporter n=1 Tax=Cereibacter sphaeroides TaxID=1063 RepID=A0A2W5SA14_CERSP|nr:MAG: MFS transporter [Cereibacter sphaeroides]